MNVIFIRPFLVVMNLVLICVTIIAFSDKSEDPIENSSYSSIVNNESHSYYNNELRVYLNNNNTPKTTDHAYIGDLNNQKLQLALQGVIDLNGNGKSNERIPHSQKIYLQYYKEDQELRKEHLKWQEAYAISDKILEEKKLRMAQLKEKYRQVAYPKYSNEKALRIQK